MSITIAIALVVTASSANAIQGGEEILGTNLVVARLIGIDSKTPNCGMAMISSKILVSAGHCFAKDNTSDGSLEFPEKSMWAYFPGRDVSANSGGSAVPIDKVVLVPGYADHWSPSTGDRRSQIDDIAFIFLERDLIPGYQVSIASEDDVRKIKQEGKFIDHFGYGLQSVTSISGKPYRIRLVAHPLGAARYGYSLEVDRKTISTIEDGVKAICPGDSGSPWYATIDGILKLVAVTVGGSGCGGNSVNGTLGTLIFPYLELMKTEYEKYLIEKSSKVSNQTTSGQHQWGAAYLDWRGARLDASFSLSQIIEIFEISDQMFWQSGWRWDNLPDGGYLGIQTKGSFFERGETDLAIFSIWNATEAIPGNGGLCRVFGGEGSGFSCRVPIDVKRNGKYEFTISIDLSRGKDWWKAQVKELNSKQTQEIGSIKIRSQVAVATNWNNFIEYWGPAVACNAVGKASAKFYVPKSTNPEVEFLSPSFSRPRESCVSSAGDTPPQGYIGDAVIRFGGPSQSPSTESMTYSKTRLQLEQERVEVRAKAEAEARAAAEKAAAELKAKQEAEATAAAELKAKQEEAAALAAAAKSKKTTITCVKGKLTKKVTAAKPKCPKGYKKK